MHRHTPHLTSAAVLLALVLSSLSPVVASAQRAVDAPLATPDPILTAPAAAAPDAAQTAASVLAVATTTPPPDPHLPSLNLDLTLARHPLSLGDTEAFTVTVRNDAPDPAVGLAVTVAVPAGAVAVPDVGASWAWTRGRLDGHAQATFTATLLLTQPPAGGALLLHAQARAQDLPSAVDLVGGAVVRDRTQAPASARFTPGAPALLRSTDGQRQVQFPAGGFSRPLTLSHSVQPPDGAPTPPPLAGYRPGFGGFYLTATDDANQQIHQFSQPLTITVAYTPDQLRALRIAEPDLTLFWYDTGARRWAPLATQVDFRAHTASARVDHFTGFQLGDGSSPSDAFIPSLQGFQVGLYTGNVGYEYPLALPAGPGGLKPDLHLRYDSTATDGATGLRAKQQAGWVGQGWSLSTGYIALQKLPGGDPHDSRFFSLALNGQAFDLTRGDALPGVISPTVTALDQWEWRATDETFVRIRALPAGAISGRGGSDGTNAYPRYTWTLWTKDGTQYEFQEDAWWGWECSDGQKAYLEPYKWYLSRVTDTHGNQINYTYGRASEPTPAACTDGVSGTIDYDVWPTAISWGGNPGQGAVDRYQLTLSSSPRTLDTVAERAPAQLGRAPQETRRLDHLDIASKPGSDWLPVGGYDLGYADEAGSLVSDASLCVAQCQPEGTRKLTLISLARRGEDGSGLPATTFTYGMVRGTQTYANADWNRLVSANNGQGGVVSFTYENIGAALEPDPDAGLFGNNRRVTSKAVQSRPGVVETWTYSQYQNPEYNTLGRAQGGRGPNTYPTSAVLWFNKYYHCRADGTFCQDDSGRLAHRANSEFRGHASVVETDPAQKQTLHQFYQGQADDQCTPTTISGDAILDDGCFTKIRDREFLKGREYDTIPYAGATTGPKLREDEHYFGITLYGNYGKDAYADDRLVGLWRAYRYETQTLELAWEGAVSNPASKTITYTYDLNGNPGHPQTYGNVLEMVERDDSGVLRITQHSYSLRDDSTAYIVDRKRSDNVLDATGGKVARTVYSYDDDPYWGGATMGTKGDLTLVRKYYDLGIPAHDPIHSSDTSYGYDGYGNPMTTTTYIGPGRQTDACDENDPLAPCWGAPGDGSAARITRTTYDPVFHAFPVRLDSPATGGPPLYEEAAYDYQMGTLTTVTDTNRVATFATYDGFGRLTSVVKPGDIGVAPTLQMEYHDTEQPLRYVLWQRETAGGLRRETQQFYDGSGRLIQSKSSYVPKDQPTPVNIVRDQQYDAPHALNRESVPRYVTETLTTFEQYTPPDASVAWTSTSYDALGRTTRLEAPDLTASTLVYSLSGGRRAVTTTDANGHRTERDSDLFGRLRQVTELYDSAPAASTVYTYSPLDLLTTVRDAANNTTTMTYDSAGRKTAMSDPDLGAWAYDYDVNGNVVTQTNALAQSIIFHYDALDRLTQKNYIPSGAAADATYTYDTPGAGYGLGRRTATARGGLTQSWQYDARGRVTQQQYAGGGLPAAQTFQWGYDSADRVNHVTYPGGEQLSYTYDGAWRQTAACSNQFSPCYVTTAHYSALDQPTDRSTGNGWLQSWSYSSPLQRLTQIQVGPAGNPGSAFSRQYRYDPVGNVATITNTLTSAVQGFAYDERDRLTAWTLTGAPTTSYSYDAIGNLRSKAGVTYTYGPQPPRNGGPHAVLNVGTAQYSYDANGNMTGGGGRAYTWNADNQPTEIDYGPGTPPSTVEQYSYDADGERVSRTHDGLTTFYLAGLLEADVQSGVVVATRMLYTLQGQVVATRTPGGLFYLHGDHLGSVALSVNAASGATSSQEFDPWGAVRSGGVPQTSLNYTGQRKDDTGLLYYHARYYDPALARWTSPDSIVPGAAMGAGGALGTLGQDQQSALRPLTVDFHEPGLAAGVASEDRLTQQQGFWFQLSDHDRQKAPAPWGPGNPQALNRYSYVLDNPLHYTDPSGHCWVYCGDQILHTVCQLLGLCASPDGNSAVLPYSCTLAGIGCPGAEMLGWGPTLKSVDIGDGLSHSFDRHASEWFGRNVSRTNDLSEWKRIVESASRSSLEFRWSLSGAPTIARLARVDGRYFVVQYWAEGAHAGEFADAFLPRPDQLSAMLRLLGIGR